MTSSNIRKRERADLVKFTIFLLVAAMFTYWVGVITSSHRPADRVEYTSAFSDVSGLGKGDAVRISGVDVGRVTDIQVQPNTEVLVTFSVPRTQTLTRSTEAAIQYRNLVGDRIVQLSRGDGDAEAADLAVGGTIPSSQTTPALDLDLLLNGFKPLFQGLTPNQINDFSGELIKVLQGQSSSISTLVEQAASFTNTVGDRQDLVTAVIRNLNTVVGTFDDKRDSIAQLIDGLSTLVDGLEEQDTQVLDAAERIDGLATDGADLVSKARTDLNPDLEALRVAASGINSERDTLEQVLNKLPKHYTAIQNTASYGNFFNFFLCGVRIQTGLGDQIIQTPWINSDVARCKK